MALVNTQTAVKRHPDDLDKDIMEHNSLASPRSPPQQHWTKPVAKNGLGTSGFADFFGNEVFQLVLHNPTTAHQLLKFSQSRLCGENMEFLEKLNQYHGLLDSLNKTLSEIQRDFTLTDAPRQLNIAPQMTKKINADIRTHNSTTLPALDMVFAESQEYIERLLLSDTFPRFVRHQMTMSATRALSTDRGRYQGLGDCFCLTDPAKADNPIIGASDGFVSVTGYSRRDIIPRNCRFLQGDHTDRAAVARLKGAIRAREESVELVLNYRKSGEPFWNLLYVAPLLNSEGRVSFFLGAQINCSTTIHSSSDILRVLSMSEDLAEEEINKNIAPSLHRSNTGGHWKFLKNFKTHRTDKRVEVREAGMEHGLLHRIEKMNLGAQMKMFYTAYSKYLVLSADRLRILFYSQGIMDLLYVNEQDGAQFVGRDIFQVLSQHATSISRDFKYKVKEPLAAGRAVSVDISMLEPHAMARRFDVKFVTHWTPLKDEEGEATFVILTLSSRMAV